jgi:CheY-like chemotaxis protein
MPDETISHRFLPCQGTTIGRLIVWGHWMANACKVAAYTGSAVGVTGGLLAQTSAQTGAAGVILGITGIVTALGAVATSIVNSIMQDRKDARENEKLKDELAQAKQEIKTNRDEIERLKQEEIPAARVRDAGIEGQMDAFMEVLQRRGMIATPPDIGGIARARQTILIVEDDADLAKAWKRLFSRAGFVTELAATLDEAMTKVEAGPNCMLLDLNLATSDGLEVLKKVRAENLPVRVAITTGPMQDARLAAVAGLLGDNDEIFEKPIKFRDLLSWLAPDLDSSSRVRR